MDRRIPLSLFSMKMILFVSFFLVAALLQAEEVGDPKDGKKIFERTEAAIGHVDQILNLQTKGVAIQAIEFGNLEFPVEVVAIFPNKFILKLRGKEYIVDNEDGWLKYPGGFFENLPKEFAEQILENLKRNIIYLIKNKKNIEFSYLGKATIQEKECWKLLVTDKNSSFELFIDINTNLPSLIKYKDNENTISKYFLGYKKIENILFPIKTISYDNENNLISKNIIEVININIELDE